MGRLWINDHYYIYLILIVLSRLLLQYFWKYFIVSSIIFMKYRHNLFRLVGNTESFGTILCLEMVLRSDMEVYKIVIQVYKSIKKSGITQIPDLLNKDF